MADAALSIKCADLKTKIPPPWRGGHHHFPGAFFQLISAAPTRLTIISLRRQYIIFLISTGAKPQAAAHDLDGIPHSRGFILYKSGVIIYVTANVLLQT